MVFSGVPFIDLLPDPIRSGTVDPTCPVTHLSQPWPRNWAAMGRMLSKSTQYTVTDDAGKKSVVVEFANHKTRWQKFWQRVKEAFAA